MMSQFVRHKNAILLGILIIFHTVGIIGLMSSSRDYFLTLSPLNLLLSIACLWFSYHSFSMKRLLDFLYIGVIGFSAEWIGVHTGYLFGDYQYGANLGVKALGIPLLIAVNWAMLSFTACSFFVKLSVPAWVKALLSASLMTGLDVLIEPVAIQSDFWSWNTPTIPIWNYACWWLVAFPLHWWIFKNKTVEQNKVSIGLFLILSVFFGILNFV